MKKFLKIFFTLFLLFSCINCFAQETDTTPKPYEDQEFEQWQLDLRRFEIITLGSMPFITLDTIIIYSGITWGINGFQGAFPNPFSAMASYSQGEIIGIILTSFTISLCIAITDYFIIKAKREKAVQNKTQQIYVMPEELNPPVQDVQKPDE
jgi:hypothetical protein